MKTKTFDSVKTMRNIRNSIDEDISKMTVKQILEYLKDARCEYNEATGSKSLAAS